MKTHFQFLADVVGKKGDNFWFTSVYRGAKEPVEATCKTCLTDISRPAESFYTRGCPSCEAAKRGMKARVSIDFVERTISSRGGKLIHSEYIDSHLYVTYECGAGNISKVPWNSIQQGHWCNCCKHQSESLVRNILELALGIELTKCRPDILRNPETGRNLEFDGYNEDEKIAFEYDGGGHKNPNHIYCHSNVLDRDEFKRRASKSHDVTLIEVDRIDKFNDLRDKVASVLDQIPHGICYSEVKIEEISSICRAPECWLEIQKACTANEQTIITPRYIGVKGFYNLQCHKKHEPYVLRGESINEARTEWCLECAGKTLEQRVDQCKEIIVAIGGKFISAEAISLSRISITYKCQRGHKNIDKRSDHIVDGHWCGTCYKDRSSSKAYMKLMDDAGKRYARLLSNKYFGKNRKHKFQCILCGEVFNRTPHELRCVKIACPSIAHRAVQHANLQPRNTEEGMKSEFYEYLKLNGCTYISFSGNCQSDMSATYVCKANKHACKMAYLTYKRRKIFCHQCELEKITIDKPASLNFKMIGAYFGWNEKTHYECNKCRKLLYVTPRTFSMKRRPCCSPI
ncbi:hypothetical protein [Microbulbifer sp. HZ11]|uniref:hypothetical protein n=1 Tax=Microbulbifer sp. HZ11 TaxID=1453501 RepID=UPI0012DE9192|nr:hypothetical protein [Microbulbifer sp. HZ11]